MARRSPNGGYHPVVIPVVDTIDQTCQLAVGCKENIVATGTTLEYRKPNVLVVIDMVLSPDAHLPIRTTEVVYVSDGLGQHILWPEKLVSQAAVVNKVSKSVIKAFKEKLELSLDLACDRLALNGCSLFEFSEK
ncbi:hypothetical protein CUMW_254150 [Citrus unshiu]|uniref:Uncharacterized protein n=1 Tax=Citrus unshiu TaxID=55188 RepID=A0A2H5QS86_CITUN|nr:hypothetical protein CUMW_254150 [Citrus unshiu]